MARRPGRHVLRVGVTRYLVSDLLQLGFVRDALEVVAGRVRPFEGSEFLSGEFDLQRGDRVVDLGGVLAPTSGAVTIGLLCSQARAT
jgi:hypothetical protein